MIRPPAPSDYPTETVVPPSGGVFTKGCEAMNRQPDDPGVDPFFEDDSGPHLSVIVVGALATFLCLAGALWASKAWGHQAPSGWTYPFACCAGNDCAEIPASSVKDSPAGYFVTVVPGSHPMWPVSKPQALQLTVPYSKAEASPDGRWHLCINAAGAVLCFYHVPGGM